jgi:hypothetical protein
MLLIHTAKLIKRERELLRDFFDEFKVNLDAAFLLLSLFYIRDELRAAGGATLSRQSASIEDLQLYTRANFCLS